MSLIPSGNQLRAIQPGSMPPTTPLKNLGFDAAEIKMLTPQVQNINKGQLLQITHWAASGQHGPNPLNLTLHDLQTLESAGASFEARVKEAGGLAQAARAAGGLAGDVSVSCCCCSCTPCCSCCAAAETVPFRSPARLMTRKKRRN